MQRGTALYRFWTRHGYAGEGHWWLKEAQRLYRELGNVWGVATALSGIGGAAALQSDLEDATRALDESARLFEQVGDRLARAKTLILLAWAF